MTLLARALLLAFVTVTVTTTVWLGWLRAPNCAHPAASWLACDGFEAGADLHAWFEASDFVLARGLDNPRRLALVADGRRGRGLLVAAAPPDGLTGGSVTWLDCPGGRAGCRPRQHERLYLRTWLRLAPDHRHVRHFIEVGGRSRMHAFGSAGCLPNGHDEFMTFADLAPARGAAPRQWVLYSYHLDMACDPNCGRYLDVEQRCAECAARGFPTCRKQPRCCWGNTLRATPPVPVATGRWQCVEFMVRANTPGRADGGQVLWLDGLEVLHQDGLRWRSDGRLGVSYVSLQQYNEPGETRRANRVWFDDVVVATERIGC